MLTEEEFNKEIFDRMMLVEEFVEFNLRSSDKREEMDLWLICLINYCFLKAKTIEGKDTVRFKKMFLEVVKEGCNKFEKEIGD